MFNIKDLLDFVDDEVIINYINYLQNKYKINNEWEKLSDKDNVNNVNNNGFIHKHLIDKITPKIKEVVINDYYQIAELIQLSLLIDCVDFIGLHNLIGKNVLDNKYRNIFKTFFTQYTHYYLKHKLGDIQELVNKSIKLNCYNNLNKVEKNKILKSFNYRVNELSLINKYILINSDIYHNEINIKKSYDELLDFYECNCTIDSRVVNSYYPFVNKECSFLPILGEIQL